MPPTLITWGYCGWGNHTPQLVGVVDAVEGTPDSNGKELRMAANMGNPAASDSPAAAIFWRCVLVKISSRERAWAAAWIFLFETRHGRQIRPW
jgi:hypothetical protein